ncbi:hypothetical protein HZU75_11975 [Chitinibacter fontanus]|uniref:Uncharacterized protein n=1 Tax=Chitinibacter fontanus TaxID=1737446 RepID=A0A7D5ZDT4_9NEIS|nr:hypothetical protein [Chitinibacter fontanus]QLI82185.1 hypothetical protein HZU75_11975 [Chitinibacter fontanus]
MKKLIFALFLFFISCLAHADTGAEDFLRLEKLMVSATDNPVKFCTDRGLNKLAIMMIVGLTRKNDEQAHDYAFQKSGVELLDAQLANEEEIWRNTHSPESVALSKFGNCLATENQEFEAKFKQVAKICFNNSQFPMMVKILKDINATKERVYAILAKNPPSMPMADARKFTDAMLATTSDEEALNLGRQFFASCMIANAQVAP